MLTLSEIAINVPHSISVMEKYGINFYTYGSKTLHDACKERNLDYETVDNEIYSDASRSYEELNKHTNFENLDLVDLVDYIEEKFHTVETPTLNLINRLLTNATMAYPHHNKALTAIHTLLGKLTLHLKQHTAKEDKILFPFIKKLVSLKNNPDEDVSFEISVLSSPIKALEQEHKICTDKLMDIRIITNNYTCPDAAGELYKLLMFELERFEKAFHYHIHLENNILFPKLREIELSVMSNARNN